jgi:hypothetical protein
MRQNKAKLGDRDGGSTNTDICNVPTHLLPGLMMNLNMTKANHEIYLMSKAEDSEAIIKFLDAQILVERIRPYSAYLIAHNTALQGGAIVKYYLNSIELKTFTFVSGSQSLSIDNVIIGPITIRLLFTMM